MTNENSNFKKFWKSKEENKNNNDIDIEKLINNDPKELNETDDALKDAIARMKEQKSNNKIKDNNSSSFKDFLFNIGTETEVDDD